jgi:TRAP-type C4-dicarboxylate transport system permease small subunit
MERFVRIIDRMTNAFGIIAGTIMLLGVALVITEIIARTFFNSTIYITEEYTGYFMVAITFLGLAYTLKEKGHIRMVFLHGLIKGGKARFYLGIYTFIVGLAVFTVITVVTANFFWDAVVTGTRSMQISKTYLAIPQFAMPFGSLLITLQFASEIARTIIKFRTGEMDKEDTESQALGR